MNNAKDKEKNIFLAFFDILGTSKLLNDGEYQKVHNFYLEMVKLCSDSVTPIVIHNPLYGKKPLFPELSDVMADLADFNTPYHIIDYDLHHAFFSDTFLLWIEVDELHRPTLSGFLEKCCIVFCEAIRRGIALRGVISAGSAIMDNENRIYLGMPLAEAAKAERQQNWMGIGLGRSILNIHQMDMEYLLPFFNHIKEHEDKSEILLGGWVLDWPSWWYHEYQDDVTVFIEKMNTDEKFSSYYSNCLSFINVSKQREIVWTLYMLFSDLHKVEYLCSLGGNLDTEQLQMRTQGIELLRSPETKSFVNRVLNMDTSLWLDDKSRDVLLALQNEILVVGGKEYKINFYKDITPSD